MPVSRFSFSPLSRGWSAGRRQGAGAAPFTGLRGRCFAPRFRDPSLEGGGDPGARAVGRPGGGLRLLRDLLVAEPDRPPDDDPDDGGDREPGAHPDEDPSDSGDDDSRVRRAWTA